MNNETIKQRQARVKKNRAIRNEKEIKRVINLHNYRVKKEFKLVSKEEFFIKLENSFKKIIKESGSITDLDANYFNIPKNNFKNPNRDVKCIKVNFIEEAEAIAFKLYKEFGSSISFRPNSRIS